MAELTYNRGKTRILAGDTPLDSADLRMLILVTSIAGANDPDLDTIADLDAVGTVAIHSERVALTTETVTQDDTNNLAQASADPVVFAAAPGVTALAAVVVDYAGGGADNARFLISYHDTGFPQPMDGGLTVNNPTGWLRGT